MFSFNSLDAQSYESFDKLAQEIGKINHTDIDLEVSEIVEIVETGTDRLDSEGNPIIELILRLENSNLKFHESGIKEFCKAIKYSFSNFKVLNEVNIIDDLNYRINALRGSDTKLIFRVNQFKHITHCYPYKSDKPAGAPLFNEELLLLMTSRNDIFNEDNFKLGLLDENNLCMVFTPSNTNGIGEGIVIHNNEQAGKGGLYVGVAYNGTGFLFLDTNENSLRRSIELPRDVTSQAIMQHLNSLELNNIEPFDEVCAQLIMKVDTTTQKVGYLYRNMKGVPKKDKQEIFKNFLVHIQDEPMDEILPTHVIRERNYNLYNLLCSNMEGSDNILQKDNLKVPAFINTALFGGDLLDPSNLIYTNFL